MSHKLLQRQLKKHLGEFQNDPRLTAFLKAVGESYEHFDRDRQLLERSMNISSEELREANKSISNEINKQQLAIIQLIESLENLNIDIEDNKDITSNLLAIAEKVKEQTQIKKEIEKKLQDNINHLKKINHDLDQFAYVVSHDLKAPLRAISSLAEWIEEDAGDKLSEDSHRNLQLLKGRVLRMEKLIHGILAYAKAGKIKGDHKLIDSATFVHEVVEILSTNNAFHCAFSGEWPIFETDTIRLHQVLLNLISNAIKHNDKETTLIQINCLTHPTHCEISITDNGPGIEPEYHQKIFVLFQTLTTRDQFESTGIGLSIVKKIIEEQGGEIHVRSKIGEGTTFTFTWPFEPIQPIKTSTL
jgi:light-regulated signal transduction histidine kinase (bacteriophytochrome)